MTSFLLLEIPSPELKFIFEPKKQSNCSVQLVNKTDHHVAFKVKTTSPKKYCVRPNVGVILPKETCEFVVTMQAQRSAPPDMICKDKFLVQSTIVPAGTREENVTSEMFSKDDGKYIEEKKLRVILLVILPHSPELLPLNGALKQASSFKSSTAAEELLHRVEKFSSHDMDEEHVKESKTEEHMNKESKAVNEEPQPKKDTIPEQHMREESKAVNNEEPKPKKDTSPEQHMKEESKAVNSEEPKPKKDTNPEPKPKNDTNPEPKPKKNTNPEPISQAESELIQTTGSAPDRDVQSKLIKVKESIEREKESRTKTTKGLENTENVNLAKDVEEMKLKLFQLESKLNKAEMMITKLTDESRLTIQEREQLQRELVGFKNLFLAFLRTTRKAEKTVEEGYPLMFVCLVALVSVVLGYCLHP